MTVSRKLCTWALGAAILGGSIAAVAAKDGLNIRLRDDCDPATFNAPPPAGVGPGTCVGGGGTTFANFLAEFGVSGRVEKWKFNNDRAEVDRGTPITLTNRGGETHTFTRVAEFGGGVVPPLNARPAGPPLVTAPEGFAPPSQNNITVPAGATVVDGPTVGRRETAKFQCCIHPW